MSGWASSATPCFADEGSTLNPRIMKIAILMTCHNRRETTLRCLESLALEKRVGVGQWKIDVFLVDDGSTDGTREEVGELSGSGNVRGSGSGSGSGRIHLIEGDGTLFWAKGMELAWRTALEEEKLHCPTPTQNSHYYDGFLWLNDDVELNAEALSKLELEVGVEDRVVVGELINARGEVTYGIRGDLFTGNFVYVPRSVYEKLGMICGDYHHAWADSDYAMRCKRAGVPVVSCGVVGRCDGHPNRPSLKGLSLRERWAMLGNPKGWCLHDLWLYRQRNWGVLAALVSCVHLVCHVMRGER